MIRELGNKPDMSKYFWNDFKWFYTVVEGLFDLIR